MAGLDDAFSTSTANPNHVIFKNNRIYRHYVLRVNYTSYDVRRAEDIFNPNTEHCDIMMLHNEESEEDSYHRFCYARIMGIYHTNVQYIGPGMQDYLPRRLDFLHIRWFERVPQQDLHGLHALQFVPMDDPGSFDFMDPADVVRGCHLIPAFRHGRLHQESSSTSIAQLGDSKIWKYYYVNRYGKLTCYCL